MGTERVKTMITLWHKKFIQLFAAFTLIGASHFYAMAGEMALPKAEKTRLEVGTAGSGTTSLPLF
ncbi:MAG TPA: hypothetical protein VN826_10715, partial [Candidatus Eisenbacteria bacterium]|nr:hypothetical protein [Candidatus Eisenbacteria bacterium]